MQRYLLAVVLLSSLQLAQAALNVEQVGLSSVCATRTSSLALRLSSISGLGITRLIVLPSFGLRLNLVSHDSATQLKGQQVPFDTPLQAGSTVDITVTAEGSFPSKISYATVATDGSVTIGTLAVSGALQDPCGEQAVHVSARDTADSESYEDDNESTSCDEATEFNVSFDSGADECGESVSSSDDETSQCSDGTEFDSSYSGAESGCSSAQSSNVDSSKSESHVSAASGLRASLCLLSAVACTLMAIVA